VLRERRERLERMQRPSVAAAALPTEQWDVVLQAPAVVHWPRARVRAA
jgi:hypothetical protein